MNKKIWYLLVLVLSLTLLLAACSGGDDDKDTKSKDDPDQAEGTDDKSEGEGEDSGPQEGGTVIYALDSAPNGVFNINYYDTAGDAEVIDFFDDGLIDYDSELKPIPHIASWETEDNQHFTFKFQEGVKWHNGEELTVHDWVFALETLADPDYSGPRYANVQTIEGAPAYKEGKADEISGLNVVSDYEIEITFDKPRVNNLENLWTYPMSRKEYEGVAVADMEDADQTRVNPVGLGPFKVTKIVPGESIELEAFDDYWQGKPHLDKVIIKVIDPTLVVGEVENEGVHITGYHPSNHEAIQAIENVEIHEVPGLSYYYVGFRLGTWDGEKNIMDFEKYQNKELRQAMAYAIDREAWIKEYFFGLGEVANRPMPTAHWISADNSELDNLYPYDPEKAKELLDEAGYVDTDDDGFREDPDGNEFVVQFGHYATQNPTFEARATALTQYWEDVGLKTELTMTDAALYYEQIENADQAVEVFFGGWSTGADPDPTPLWGSDQYWNNPRWVNKENDQLLADALDMSIVADEAGIVDQEKRKQIYVEWQKLMNEELPVIPITELTDTYAVNSKVHGVEIDPLGFNSPHEWWMEQ